MGSDNIVDPSSSSVDCFNPRSRMGSDKPLVIYYRIFCCFNPRSRMGSDLVAITAIAAPRVSIHAPAWGATCRLCLASTPQAGFNPRSRMGSDQVFKNIRFLFASFNPRSRMGSDHSPRTFIQPPLSFNPRSRMGSDGMAHILLDLSTVSIHAPAWGATDTYTPLFCPLAVSIHAPAWGATWECLNRRLDAQFQSTLPHGERHTSSGLHFIIVLFQSTLPHGERRNIHVHLWINRQFQSTLPHGERPTQINAKIKLAPSADF